MENKQKLKHTLLLVLLLTILLLVATTLFNTYKYQEYTKNYNAYLESLVAKIVEEYPSVSEEELINILNGQEKLKSPLLKRYGIDPTQESIVLENNTLYKKYLLLDIGILLLSSIIITLIFLLYNHNKDKDIKEVTSLVEAINHKNYSLAIDSNSEEELSILKNEVYKTMIMLKENAEASLADKIKLKDSLSDISHQLKTPLTSILITLDNILDDPNMEEETKEEFILNIKREITNINFLVQNILTLSKFDANAIKFIEKEYFLKDVIKDSLKNVAHLCELKNITINFKESNEKIVCDLKWQTEALTNILKNCLEHSYPNSKIDISLTDAKLYKEIKITDYGKGIAPEDLNHIFERFYKGKNSSPDSVGIGLALAKSIIEAANGTIKVNSILNEGTTFIIRYYS